MCKLNPSIVLGHEVRNPKVLSETTSNIPYKQGCGAVTFLVGSCSGSGSGAAFRLRLRLRFRVKLFGGSGSEQNVPAPAVPAPAPAPMIKSSYEPKPAIRFSKMPNVKI